MEPSTEPHPRCEILWDRRGERPCKNVLMWIQLSRNVRKCIFGHMRPAKILISLRIREVWSESSLGAFWVAKAAKFLHADNEDSDQIAQRRSLIWVFVGHTCQKVRFLTLSLICLNQCITICHAHCCFVEFIPVLPYDFLVTIPTPNFVGIWAFYVDESVRFRLWGLVSPRWYPGKSVWCGNAYIVIFHGDCKGCFSAGGQTMSGGVGLTPRFAPSETIR